MADFIKNLEQVRAGFYAVPFQMEAQRVLDIARIYGETPLFWLTPVDTGLKELFGIPVKYNPEVKQLTLEVERQ